MGRKWGIGLALAASVFTAQSVAVDHLVSATTGTLPSGASLSVDIDNPLDDAVVVSGTPITVSGTAAVGEAPAVKNTDLVFVLDTSGSTNDPSGISCGTVLQCEKAAVLDLVTQANAPRSPIGNIGMAAFPSTSVLALTAPDSPSIPAYLDGLSPSGGTDFSAGITRARQILSTSVAGERLIVLLTDGEGTSNPNEPAIEAVVLAFTIGGQQCTAPLELIVDQGLGGSACAAVTNLADLSGVINETIGSSLDTVTVAVDGAPVYTATPAVVGPGSAAFSTTVTGLTVGPHVICATANGSDASGSGSVQECVDVTVIPPGGAYVDCGTVNTNCTATATDAGRSTLLFDSPPAFDETVTIIPNRGAANACGGSACTTGYDVLFPTTSATGPIVSLTVTTTNKVTLLQRLNAAIYIDNVRITAQCNNRVIIKIVRDLLGKPEPIPCITIQYLSSGKLEYFVKFRADPGVRFR